MINILLTAYTKKYHNVSYSGKGVPVSRTYSNSVIPKETHKILDPFEQQIRNKGGVAPAKNSGEAATTGETKNKVQNSNERNEKIQKVTGKSLINSENTIDYCTTESNMTSSQTTCTTSNKSSPEKVVDKNNNDAKNTQVVINSSPSKLLPKSGKFQNKQMEKVKKLKILNGQ